MNDIKNKIIDVLFSTEDPMSSSAISRACGFSEKTKTVDDAINELLEEGKIGIDDTGNYEGFYFFHVQDACGLFEDICEEPVEEEREFSIRKVIGGVMVVTPEGETKLLKNGERIISVNGRPDHRYVVETPEDALAAVKIAAQELAEEEGFDSYVIRDLRCNRTVSISEIDVEPVILHIDVVPHNKAG